ncbi:MAG: hypothetical protein JNK82_33755 [Myxococcaceae bacterium]|nr:hypothetical protein [Myxococcaceae bacterium]
MHPAAAAERARLATVRGMHPADAQRWAQGFGGPQPAHPARPAGDVYGGGVRWSRGDTAAQALTATAEFHARQFEAIFGISNVKVEVVPTTSWGPGTAAELVDLPGPIESMRIAATTELWRLPTIVAHEYGHALQIAAGYDPGDVARELDATRIAGRYLRLSGNSIDLALADLSSFAGSAVHGTRDQQVAALLEGYQSPDGAWFQPYQAAVGRNVTLRAPSGGGAAQQPFRHEVRPLSQAEEKSLSWQLGLQTWDAMLQVQIDFSAAHAAGTLSDPGERSKLDGRLRAARSGIDALSAKFGDGERLFWLDGASGELKLPITLGRLKADVASLENLLAGTTLNRDLDGFRFVRVEDQERGKVWTKQRNVVFSFERDGKDGKPERLDVRVQTVRYAPAAILPDEHGGYTQVETPAELQARRTAVPLPTVVIAAPGEEPSVNDVRYALRPEQVQALFGDPTRFADALTARRAQIIAKAFASD